MLPKLQDQPQLKDLWNGKDVIRPHSKIQTVHFPNAYLFRSRKVLRHQKCLEISYSFSKKAKSTFEFKYFSSKFDDSKFK